MATLMSLFQSRFGQPPLAFRSGRYGLGRETLALLEDNGFLVDTSLAPHSSFSGEQGPDFSADDYSCFWFGRTRRLLELPLCRTIVGWGGPAAARAYHRLSSRHPHGSRLLGLLARSRCAERVTLSPEGNDVTAAGRLAASLLEQGQKVLSLSFHSSSLRVGRNPYVQSRADLHDFYDRLSAFLDMLAGRFGVRFCGSLELPAMLSDA